MSSKIKYFLTHLLIIMKISRDLLSANHGILFLFFILFILKILEFKTYFQTKFRRDTPLTAKYLIQSYIITRFKISVHKFNTIFDRKIYTTQIKNIKSNMCICNTAQDI